MRHWKLLLLVPVAALVAAMAPQGRGSGDPALEDQNNVITLSELQYTTADGKTAVISARNVVEIRLIEDHTESIRLELYYDNTDYSLIDVQAFHLLRNGQATREVRLVRGRKDRMRFPKGI
jgi:hypothetical protein